MKQSASAAKEGRSLLRRYPCRAKVRNLCFFLWCRGRGKSEFSRDFFHGVPVEYEVDPTKEGLEEESIEIQRGRTDIANVSSFEEESMR